MKLILKITTMACVLVSSSIIAETQIAPSSFVSYLTNGTNYRNEDYVSTGMAIHKEIAENMANQNELSLFSKEVIKQIENKYNLNEAEAKIFITKMTTRNL